MGGSKVKQFFEAFRGGEEAYIIWAKPTTVLSTHVLRSRSALFRPHSSFRAVETGVCEVDRPVPVPTLTYKGREREDIARKGFRKAISLYQFIQNKERCWRRSSRRREHQVTRERAPGGRRLLPLLLSWECVFHTLLPY